MKNLVRKALAPVRWRTKRFGQIRKSVSYYSSNARKSSIEMHGLPFITSFPEIRIQGMKRREFNVGISTSTYESPVAVSLSILDASKKPVKDQRYFKRDPKEIAQAKISFRKKIVVVEALQGELGSIEWLDRFRNKTGVSWAQYLTARIEEHARKMGFKQVKITIPERLRYYNNPVVSSIRGESDKQKIMENMRKLYYATAEKMGYKKEGDYFVKNL